MDEGEPRKLTAKQAMLEILQTAPEDLDWEEAHYQLLLRQRVEEGQAAKARGEVYSLEEAREMAKSWISRYPS